MWFLHPLNSTFDLKKLKIGTPRTHALGHVYANFGFINYFVFESRSRTGQMGNWAYRQTNGQSGKTRNIKRQWGRASCARAAVACGSLFAVCVTNLPDVGFGSDRRSGVTWNSGAPGQQCKDRSPTPRAPSPFHSVLTSPPLCDFVPRPFFPPSSPPLLRF